MYNKGSLNVKGNITGKHIIKEGGTSNQFLKADGTVDDSLYIIDGEIDGVLYGRKDHQWVEITGGGGGLQNLQEVTDVGNETTNNIIINGNHSGKSTLSPTRLTIFDSSSRGLSLEKGKIKDISTWRTGGFQLTYSGLLLSDKAEPGNPEEYITSYLRDRIVISPQVGTSTFPRGTFVFPNLPTDTTERRLPVSVNGEVADENGNITIDTGGGVLTTTVEISSAQLLALASTPVELIPAQGAGTYISIENYIYSYEYGTEDYDFNPLPNINGVTTFGSIFFVNLRGSTSRVVRVDSENATLSENTPITLEYSGTGPTQGDGTLKLILTYKIINI